MTAKQATTGIGSRRIGWVLISLGGLIAFWATAGALELDKSVADAQDKRLKAIDKVRPTVVAVFARGGQGGGSGVLISPEGYALTNFHVVQPTGPVMQCGLADGVLYDAVLVGLDPVGDVALIKLLAKEKIKGADGKEIDKPFPYAAMGDSEKVRPGDWSLAMGNPFLLATDFTPTVTFGLISGTHRYQYPSGTILEYTDCIQIDASINPGNSGGPLYNLDGEVIGINGRGSFEKRGRVNSGVGYAISINQIRNFMGHLRAGLVVDHATLGASVEPGAEGRGSIVTGILEESDAFRRGLRLDDELVSFAGRPITTVNQFKNVLGIYPRGWRLPMEYRQLSSDTGQPVRKEVLVRLMGVQKREVPDNMKPAMPPVPDPNDPPKPPAPRPGPRPGPPAPPADNPATKLYEKKDGFANHYFNKLERDRLAAAFGKQGDFSKAGADWTIAGDEIKPETRTAGITLNDKLSKLNLGKEEFRLEPLDAGGQANLRDPRGSGGLMLALWEWRRFLTQGAKGFEKFTHGGYEPYYPDGTLKSRVDAEVLLTELATVHCKWYFARTDQALLGVECFVDRESDPCELTFFEYKDVDGKKLPHKLQVRYGNKEFGVYTVKTFKFDK